MNGSVVRPAPATASGHAYAGFRRRFAAFVIDFTAPAAPTLFEMGEIGCVQ